MTQKTLLQLSRTKDSFFRPCSCETFYFDPFYQLWQHFHICFAVHYRAIIPKPIQRSTKYYTCVMTILEILYVSMPLYVKPVESQYVVSGLPYTNVLTSTIKLLNHYLPVTLGASLFFAPFFYSQLLSATA